MKYLLLVLLLTLLFLPGCRLYMNTTIGHFGEQPVYKENIPSHHTCVSKVPDQAL